MEQLQFTAVHEDGQQLVLSAPDGTEFRLPIDERLRSALRSRGPAADAPAAQLSPRDVQAMFRAGQSAAEVAELTGWPVDRVERFEAPITAEREHVAGLARAAHVRGRSAEGSVPTLETRVLERLEARGVDPDNTSWDATRPAGGPWTVVVNFVAGQRQRAAAWRFEPADRTVEALDDEARWLSEDEQALPGSAAGKQLLGSHGVSEEVDLVTSMRERSRTRSRRKKPAVARGQAGAEAGTAEVPEPEVGAEPEETSEPRAGADETVESARASRAEQGADPERTEPAKAPEDVLPLEHAPASGSGDPTPASASKQSADKEPASGGPKPRRAKGRGRSGRARSGRSGGSAPEKSTPEKSAPTTRSAQAKAAEPTPAAPPAPEATPVSYDVELDFDDDYEVDPTPQEATLADLFGPGDPHPEEVSAEDYLDGDDDFEADDHPDDGGHSEHDGTHAEEGAHAEDGAGHTVPPSEAADVPAAAAPDLAFDNDDEAPAGDGLSGKAPASTPDATAASTPDETATDRDAGASEDDTSEGDADAGGTSAEPEVPAEPAPAAKDPADAAPEAAQPGAKRRKDGRPGVPSWDDIMFGAKDRK